MNYYNEFDPKAAAWLRELIKGGHIANGVVDERSITDVQPDELREYTQCHFFAGIGGWSYALRLAGWPDDRPVWTGSCPCQPFSCAGKQLGTADKRHLWPDFRRLIAECRPANVFGEQVASAAGREWLAGVRADLEGVGYAVGAADLCAAGVGAPHIRQRLFWVANPAYKRHRKRNEPSSAAGGRTGSWPSTMRRGEPSAVAVAVQPQQPSAQLRGDAGGFWSRFDLIHCTDGKARRIEPGSFPLAHGVPGRVGLLRGYGNAIVPQVTAEFIGACLDGLGGSPLASEDIL